MAKMYSSVVQDYHNSKGKKPVYMVLRLNKKAVVYNQVVNYSL